MKPINHIIRLLNSNEVDVCFVYFRDGSWGECDYCNKELLINKRLCTASRVTTLIHECLHFVYSTLNEDEVLIMEKEVYDALTFDEMNFLRDFLRSKE